jgi:hypothetical protein
MELYEIKNFCTTKEMISKLKRPPTEWKNIFASYTSDKGLITRIYRELKKLNSTQKKMTQYRNGQLIKGRCPNGQKHMKKCSPSLAKRKCKSKPH